MGMKVANMVTLAYLLFHACLLFPSSTSAYRSTYIVHKDMSVMPKAFASHDQWYLATLNSLKAVNGSTTSNADNSTARLLYTYTNAIHGFSAVLSPEELETLKKSHGFVSAYPDRTVKLHTTHTTEFLSLNPNTGLWPASNFGKDVIVGVIDSGVWPESESFKDDGMTEVPASWKGACDFGGDSNTSLCNRKLIGARFFNKGGRAAGDDSEDMNTARDMDGHGTHIASTIAGNYVEGASFFGYANGTARGVAPRARLAVYNPIFSFSGYSSDIIASIDQAIADGVDVISISMGFDRIPLYEDPIAIASFAAMEKGVLVSSSAGNDGPLASTVKNGAPWLLTVGASSDDRQFAGTLTLGNGVSIVGWSLFPANAWRVGVSLVYNETLLACNSSKLLSDQAAGSIVICLDNSNLGAQIDNVTASSVAGAIFVSNDPHFFEAGDLPCPAVVISPMDVPKVIEYAKSSDSPSVTMKFQQTFIGTKTAPSAATYSSRGPANHPGILKPDLVAPGTKVLAAWIPNTSTARIGLDLELTSDYILASGTSASCPQASGVAALLKGAHPDWSPAAIRSAMMTTANPLDNTFNPMRDNGDNHQPATPLAIGSGQVDPNKALDPGLIYDADAQDYVNFLCSLNFTREQLLTITRSSSYNCSTISSDLNYPSFVALFSNTSRTVQEFHRTVTNVGDGASTYRVKLMLPKGISISVTPDTLVFKEKHEKLSFVVSVKGGPPTERNVSYGSLVWADDGGNHTVRSPIVVL
ncbi:hypothetical protein HHK36_002600 [Tetracentron sinense]|uniref:Subtilisin n=1 Tax=Tetracentron sinense TaxID=13715 RepID=A0A834ZRR6_TETSI|nr:hypothetical protein HHK36_002600 [Tetracentron sinense]